MSPISISSSSTFSSSTTAAFSVLAGPEETLAEAYWAFSKAANLYEVSQETANKFLKAAWIM
jgi:hypothetical protein